MVYATLKYVPVKRINSTVTLEARCDIVRTSVVCKYVVTRAVTAVVNTTGYLCVMMCEDSVETVHSSAYYQHDSYWRLLLSCRECLLHVFC